VTNTEAPKGTDLSVHTREHLNAVASELNSRPRKTLGWETPTERLSTLLKAQQSRSSAFRRHAPQPRQGER
jgi:IS30 family transposase